MDYVQNVRVYNNNLMLTFFGYTLFLKGNMYGLYKHSNVEQGPTFNIVYIYEARTHK